MNVLKNEQKPRITIYCNDEEQQQKIRSRLEVAKVKYCLDTNADVLDFLLLQMMECNFK